MHKNFYPSLSIEMYQISIRKIFVFIYDFKITRRVGTLMFHTTANEVDHLK